MELILNREQTMKAVNVAGKFAESPSGLKVLQGVFVSAGFGHVRLTTTDLSIWCQVELDAQTPQPGTVLVPVRTLGKALKSLPGSRVTLTKDGDDVNLTAGPSEVRVSGIDADEYPEINPPDGRLVQVPLHASLVDSVAYAVSKDETRYTLAGVRAEVGAAGFKLAATDGQRLARYQAATLPPGSVVNADLEEPVSGTVPVRLLNEGVRLASQLDGTATLELYEKASSIRVNGSAMIWADLIEGQYPDYEQVMPAAYAGCVTMPKGMLGAAVSRLVALTQGRQVVSGRLIPADGQVVLSIADDAGDGVSAVEHLSPCGIQGSVPACGLNLRHLHDALERLPDAGPVHLKFSDDTGVHPLAIESPGRQGLVAIVMVQPVKKT